MAKLIQNIFENKLQVFLLLLVCLFSFRHALFVMLYLRPLCLQAHVREKLDETRHSDVEQYLKNLYDLYTRYLTCSRVFDSHPVYAVTFMFTFLHTLVLFYMFSRTTALATKLTEFNLGSDKHTFLSKLIKSIFSSYLESYIDMEREYLRTRGAMILQRYYDSKNHQKRPIGTGRSDFGSSIFSTSGWVRNRLFECFTER